MRWYEPLALRCSVVLMSDARRAGCGTKSSATPALCGARSWLLLRLSGADEPGGAGRLLGRGTGEAAANGWFGGVLTEEIKAELKVFPPDGCFLY